MVINSVMNNAYPIVRNTRQRQVILENLKGRMDHPTAEEVFLGVRRVLPRISLGTVYRNLDLLARMGEAIRIDVPGGQARFDADTHPHYHVRCVVCGEVDDVTASPSGAVSLPAESRNSFEISGVRIEFEGKCPRCAAMCAVSGSR